jgi:hypothetical protein
MFDTATIFFVGGLLLVVGFGFVGILACRPSTRAVRLPEKRGKRTQEEVLADEILRLQETFRNREDAGEADSERRLRMELYREQYAGLAKMAPRSAIVKIWREIELNVTQRASEELEARPVLERVEYSDAKDLLKICEVIDETEVSLLEGLEGARNMVASMGPVSITPDSAMAYLEISAGLADSLGALEKLAPDAIEKQRRRSERGVVVKAFSVMPLTKTQRLVAGREQGTVMLTPEVVKQRERLKRGS